MTRRILLAPHGRRTDMHQLVGVVATQLAAHNIECVMSPDTYQQHDDKPNLTPADHTNPANGCELVLVLGGDGTILRAAHWAHTADIPLIGINYGHVGFLAEAEPNNLATTIDRIATGNYHIHPRMTLAIEVWNGDQLIDTDWALNEVTVEKASRARMIQTIIEIDDRPLSTWGCDGVILATPTGSTAYAFSSGGPVVWPDADSILIVPIAAHALFARPMVVSPTSVVAVELSGHDMGAAILVSDGCRSTDLPPHSRIVIRRGEKPVHLAKLDNEPFTDRIVHKFHLPVRGWRGAGPTEER
ncbi:NAD kinase [Dermatophilus congolensis]|uniref:NAD kinase n=1 Tax=Dermatophilus congolensis TaxID=1863 RepID=A0AA46BM72_9MICO|nr:NAD kinase [Dermatophilus congolensis]MBO3142379.1 NAD kinase [Dermatophilus congolensis]MBO3151370.1 NAD kinase [Dermatophilus congolensis]MBO3161626.1 NAD kinase [Dermatophilus congolensis]MBO3162656.1 NAD kinase [Dermatophilus congolensis]MBO3176209.1 NAD kinase [Dermatophilus congolensis]